MTLVWSNAALAWFLRSYRAWSDRTDPLICVCVCVCVCKREREREIVCVCGRERERDCVCVCVCAREREIVCVCVRAREEREKRLCVTCVSVCVQESASERARARALCVCDPKRDAIVVCARRARGAARERALVCVCVWWAVLLLYSNFHPSPLLCLSGPGRGGSSLSRDAQTSSPRPHPPAPPGARGIPSQPVGDIIPPASSPGSPPGGTRPEQLPRKRPGCIWTDARATSADSSTLSSSRVTELLTLSLRERPATLRRKLISAACIRDLVLSVMTIGEGRT